MEVSRTSSTMLSVLANQELRHESLEGLTRSLTSSPGRFHFSTDLEQTGTISVEAV